MNSGAHKPPMVSCPIGVYIQTLSIIHVISVITETLSMFICYIYRHLGYDDVYMPIKNLNLINSNINDKGQKGKLTQNKRKLRCSETIFVRSHRICQQTTA